jgi:hypothetical protein
VQIAFVFGVHSHARASEDVLALRIYTSQAITRGKGGTCFLPAFVRVPGVKESRKILQIHRSKARGGMGLERDEIFKTHKRTFRAALEGYRKESLEQKLLLWANTPVLGMVREQNGVVCRGCRGALICYV